jgi:CheY-like chemotaxis protein
MNNLNELPARMTVRPANSLNGTPAHEPGSFGSLRSAAAAVSSAHPRTHHILLVDSNPTLLNATRLLLKAYGYRITTAASLTAAVTQAGNHAALDLVIADYHLDCFNTGMDVISAVRAVQGASLKALLLTDMPAAIRAVGHDRDALIAERPIGGDELLALVEKLLADRSL